MRNALLALALLAPAAPALAQQDPPPLWTFGVLAIDRDAPYRGLDEGVLFAPLVRYEGEHVYVRGLRGAWRLRQTDTHELSLFGQLRLDGYDASDSDFLEGMDDRRPSLDLGLASTWTSQTYGQFELSLAADVLDRSGGYEAGAGWNGLFRAGGWVFIPGASLRWQDEAMVDYYYGVRSSEVLPGRPAYSANSALTPELSLLMTRQLAPRWSLFARISHAWLPSEITDSPIIDADGSTALILGLGYSPD